MPRRLISVFLALIVLATGAVAVEPDEQLDDPVLEARAREIGRVLRCVVCQSQSIDDSDAPLARDLRLLVRERLTAGDTNDEAIDYVVERYGDYVLLKPRTSGVAMGLWLAPLIVLGGGGLVGFYFVRRRSASSELDVADLTPEEEAKLKQLVDSNDTSSGAP